MLRPKWNLSGNGLLNISLELLVSNCLLPFLFIVSFLNFCDMGSWFDCVVWKGFLFKFPSVLCFQLDQSCFLFVSNPVIWVHMDFWFDGVVYKGFLFKFFQCLILQWIGALFFWSFSWFCDVEFFFFLTWLFCDEGCLWLSGITGSFAYNWSKPNMKPSVKIIHAR